MCKVQFRWSGRAVRAMIWMLVIVAGSIWLAGGLGKAQGHEAGRRCFDGELDRERPVGMAVLCFGRHAELAPLVGAMGQAIVDGVVVGRLVDGASRWGMGVSFLEERQACAGVGWREGGRDDETALQRIVKWGRGVRKAIADFGSNDCVIEMYIMDENGYNDGFAVVHFNGQPRLGSEPDGLLVVRGYAREIAYLDPRDGNDFRSARWEASTVVGTLAEILNGSGVQLLRLGANGVVYEEENGRRKVVVFRADGDGEAMDVCPRAELEARVLRAGPTLRRLLDRVEDERVIAIRALPGEWHEDDGMADVGSYVLCPAEGRRGL